MVRQPSSFRGLTGISIAEFNALYKKFQPLWEQAERERLERPNRQRKIGGGNKYALDSQTQVMMALVWIHLYLNTETLGILFGVHKSSISRNTRRVLKILRQLGSDTLWWREPPAKNEGKDLAQAVAENPDLLAVIDVMEVSVQRPQEREQRDALFSNKKKAHTLKTGVIVSECGEIRGVTNSHPGRTHDLTLIRRSGLLQCIPSETCVIADKAFCGIQTDLPNHSVGTPFKPGKNTPLTEAEKWANREFSRQRMIVENTIGELRNFRILANRFRHQLSLCTEVVYAVIALVNPRIALRLATAK
jgi:hypothetical protein